MHTNNILHTQGINKILSFFLQATAASKIIYRQQCRGESASRINETVITRQVELPFHGLY